jgi:hypothetical protein
MAAVPLAVYRVLELAHLASGLSTRRSDSTSCPAAPGQRPRPLGEHTGTVPAEAGGPPAEVATLREIGVIA